MPQAGNSFDDTSVDRYVFGEYEILVADRKLLYRGFPIRIQEVPLRLLIALVENPGKVVSRRELQAKMWDEQTFVDFDAGLRVAAGKLREALGDSATDPIYIETVTGRGYKFVGTVQARSKTPGPAAESAPSTDEQMPEHDPPTPLAAEKARRKIWPVLAACFVVLGASALWLYARSRPLLHSGDIATVGVIENHTKDPAFDGTLSRGLRVKLEESPYLHLKTSPKLLTETSLTSRLADCRTIGAQALVDGQITPQSNGFIIQLSTYKCSTGKILALQNATADSESTVLLALNQVALLARKRLGESNNTLESFNVPLPHATTDSLSALKSFSNGDILHLQGRDDDSIPAYKIATDLDPNFALAFARLGAVYENTGDQSLSNQYLRRAFELRDRTTDRERLYITAHYYATVTGEQDHLAETYRLWHTMYPQDPTPLNNLGVDEMMKGNSQESLRLAKEAVALDPTSNLFDAALAMAYFRNGEYAAVQKLCTDPSRNTSENFVFHEACFFTNVELGNDAGVQEQIKWSAGRPEDQGLLNDRAWIAMNSGQLILARSLFEQNIEAAQRNGLPDVAAQAALDYALLLADSGQAASVRPQVVRALSLSPNDPFVLSFAALALAREGDDEQAAQLAEKASTAAPLNTLIQTAILPTVAAVRALHKHDPKRALQVLETVRPWDGCVAMQLQPGYYRGLAYEMDGDTEHAKAEFEQVIAKKHLAPRSLYVALAMLELTKLPDSQISAQQRNDTRRNLTSLWASADKAFTPALALKSSMER